MIHTTFPEAVNPCRKDVLPSLTVSTTCAQRPPLAHLHHRPHPLREGTKLAGNSSSKSIEESYLLQLRLLFVLQQADLLLEIDHGTSQLMELVDQKREPRASKNGKQIVRENIGITMLKSETAVSSKCSVFGIVLLA
eukprot:1146015-Pelagomonas_calceolata.AAC.8